MRLYGKFTKVEKQSDGTLYVEGVASSEAVDSAGEVVKASAMRGALPDYLKFPALREMHQLIAAGKTLAADVRDDGTTFICAKVVDPVACKKVEEGVYAGFSIGGMVPPGGRNKDNQKIIEVLRLSEISLVDRPANPEAVISLVKIDQPAEPVQTSVQVPAAEAKKAEPAATPNTPQPAPASGAASPASAGGAAPVATGEADRIAAAEDAAQKAGTALRKVLVERDELQRKLNDAQLSLKAKGVPQDPKFLEAAVKAEELQKAVVDAQDATRQAGEALKKVMVERADLVLERDVLKKQLEESVAKYTTSLTELSEQKEELAKQRDEYVKKFAVAEVQLKTKGYLKAVPIEKRDDTRGADEPEQSSGKPAEGTPERALYEMKKVQRSGGSRLLPSPHGG